MNDRRSSTLPLQLLALTLPLGFALVLIKPRAEHLKPQGEVAAARRRAEAHEAPPAAPNVPIAAPLHSVRASAPVDAPVVDDIPSDGEILKAVQEDGTVVYMQRLPEGYTKPATHVAQEEERYEPPADQPPGRYPVDPRALGFKSLWDLEVTLRAKFRVPPELPVEMWMENRDGKWGVAFDVVNTDPEDPERGEGELVEPN